MRQLLSGLVLALVSANSCLASPQQQSTPRSVTSPDANSAAAKQDCSILTPPASGRPIGDSGGTRGVRDETLEQRLVEEFNRQALAVTSIEAHIQVVPSPGPSYKSQPQDVREVDAILFAQRPASLRVLAQAPLSGKTQFDIATDGSSFELALPSRHEFLTGQNTNPGHSVHALENIRPQHVLDALIWSAVTDQETVRLQEQTRAAPDSSYTLIVQKNESGPELDRTISFDSRSLRVRQMEIYGAQGHPISAIQFDEWMNVSGDAGENTGVCFPRHIWIQRPEEDYRLEILVTRIRVNQEFGRERFHLAIAPGMRPVNLNAGEPKPAP